MLNEMREQKKMKKKEQIQNSIMQNANANAHEKSIKIATIFLA